MQVIITAEAGKIKIEVLDEQQITVEHKTAPKINLPDESALRHGKAVPAAPSGPAIITTKTLKDAIKSANCGYCKRRGEPCVRHGGDDSQNYPGKAKQRIKNQPSVPTLPGQTELVKVVPEGPVPLSPNQIKSPTGAFLDPWNCEMCRNAQDLCLLHEKLNAEGKKPLIYKHNERTADVGNAS